VEFLESLEGKFYTRWLAAGGPKLIRQFKFIADRRFRFDFATDPADGMELVAIEVEGGQWIKGRHNRGKGMENDAEKYNLAALHGWRVFRFTTSMVMQEKQIKEVADYVNTRQKSHAHGN
jgi:very-short-patch-repair endonuclease